MKKESIDILQEMDDLFGDFITSLQEDDDDEDEWLEWLEDCDL